MRSGCMVVTAYRAAPPTLSGAPDAGPSSRMPRNTGWNTGGGAPPSEVNAESRLPAVHCSPEAEGGEQDPPVVLRARRARLFAELMSSCLFMCTAQPPSPLLYPSATQKNPGIDGRCGEAVSALVRLLRIGPSSPDNLSGEELLSREQLGTRRSRDRARCGQFIESPVLVRRLNPGPEPKSDRRTLRSAPRPMPLRRPPSPPRFR